MEKPLKVTIITVVLNRANILAKCIDSIKKQDYENIEYILVDGGSTDGTVGLAKSLLGDSDILVSEPDDGIYNALNKGLSLATGDIIGFLHSDDVFADDNVISEIAATFSQNKCLAVYGNIDFFDENDDQNSKNKRFWSAGAFNSTKLKWGWMPPHPSLFLHKSVYNSFGVFDESFKISGDYDFILRLFTKEFEEWSYIPKTLVHMKNGGKSTQSLANQIDKFKEDFRAVKKNNVGGVLTIISKRTRKLGQFRNVALQKVRHLF